MSHKFRLNFDGQSVVQADYNGLANEASTAEDHVYAELFRLTPDAGTIARGIICNSTGNIIQSNGASGSVLISPFRAVIGSRTLAATDAVANYQDVRSSLSIADGSTSLTSVINIAANASGNPRWDAIYAAVTVDAVSTPTTRKVKNPGTGVVTDESVSVYSYTTVTVSVVAGTPGAVPAFPAIPSDAGNVYYIGLGYVRVVNGFNGTSTVGSTNINDNSNVLPLSSAGLGVSVLRPANQSYINGGAGISGAGTSGVSTATQKEQKWTGTTSKKPAVYLPPSWQGGESRIIFIDLASAASSNWSHQHLALVDNSIDWSRRLLKWTAGIVQNGAPPWGYTYGTPNSGHLWAGQSNAPGYAGAGECAMVVGFGNTFGNGGSDRGVMLAAGGAAATAIPAAGYNVPTNSMVTGTSVLLAGNGINNAGPDLVVKITGVPLCSIVVWLEATSQFPV